MKYYLYYVGLYNNNIRYDLLKTFHDKEHLMDFLAWHQDPKGCYFDGWIQKKVYRNTYLDEINLTGNDTRIPASFTSYHKELRHYMFMDSQYKVIDVRNWYSEIMKKTSSYPHYFSYEYHEKRQLRSHKHQGRHRHTTYSFRKIKYKHVLRDRHNKEDAPYIRKKGIADPYYASGLRKISGSWKDQSKKRHQWE